MSSSEHDWRMEYGESPARTPAPITPPVLVTCIVTPRRNPPGVTLLTTSCDAAPNCMLKVEKGASRYRLLPTVNGISPDCGCADAGGADTPPGTGMCYLPRTERVRPVRSRRRDGSCWSYRATTRYARTCQRSALTETPRSQKWPTRSEYAYPQLSRTSQILDMSGPRFSQPVQLGGPLTTHG